MFALGMQSVSEFLRSITGWCADQAQGRGGKGSRAVAGKGKDLGQTQSGGEAKGRETEWVWDGGLEVQELEAEPVTWQKGGGVKP